MILSLSRPILLASIGNPAPYTNTLHSAGHHLLDAIRQHLAFPAFASKSIRPGRSSKSHLYPDLLLWQSPALMNASGPAVAKAWKEYLNSLTPDERTRAKLVILHDELERGLGEIRVSDGSKSAKGHNGLRSLAMQIGGRMEWMRIGVGIGRPSSREKDDVSRYVLREMTASEMGRIRGALPAVLEALQRITADG